MRPAGEMGSGIPTHAYFCEFKSPEYKKRYAVNIALPQSLHGNVVLTIPWIDHSGSLLTTYLHEMQQAIDMALNNGFLNRLPLSYIDFRVNRLQQQREMNPATPAPATTVLAAVSVAQHPLAKCPRPIPPPQPPPLTAELLMLVQ